MARVIIYTVIAVLTAGIGGLIMLRSLGAFGPIATTPDGPAWLGAAMGFVFFAGGTCVIIKAIYGNLDSGGAPSEAPAVVLFFYNALGYSIVVGLGTLFSWVAFGPGERQFSGSGAFLGATVGRAMFGLAGIATWLGLAWFTIRWFRRRDDSSS